MIGVLIFSRFDSTRLPGKALIRVGRKPLLQRVIDRAKGIRGADKILIATTSREIDKPIRSLARENGLECYCGALEDVALRAIDACESFGFDAFLRICGDRPLFDFELASKMCEDWRNLECDLLSTSGSIIAPPGLTCELIKIKALKQYYPQFNPSEREHVTSYFYNKKNNIKLYCVERPKYLMNAQNIRLVVDDESDIARMDWILTQLEYSSTQEQTMEKIIALNTEWNRQYNLSILSSKGKQ